jgi:hypothetical protein
MSQKLDITGKRFGFWIAIKRGSVSKSGHTQWLCKCECGTKKLVSLNSLITGNSTSCGCNHTPNLVGKKFGNLKVISLDTDKNDGRRYWLCKCKCGNTITTSTYKLREKRITSCGCNSKTPTSIANNKKHADLIIYRIAFVRQIEKHNSLITQQEGIDILMEIDKELKRLTPRLAK